MKFAVEPTPYSVRCVYGLHRAFVATDERGRKCLLMVAAIAAVDPELASELEHAMEGDVESNLGKVTDEYLKPENRDGLPDV